MFSYTEWALTLLKAAGHKYIKRIPYQSGGKLRYRYIYNVTHTHQGKHVLDPDHMKVGTKLMLDATSGKEVHGHITAVSGDKVTFAYDDGPRKGEVVTMGKERLAAELDKVHGISEKLSTARAKQKAVVDKLKERGASEKQIAREQKRLDALGGKAEKERGQGVKGLSPSDLATLQKVKEGDAPTLERLSDQDLERLKQVVSAYDVERSHRLEAILKPHRDAYYEASRHLDSVKGAYHRSQEGGEERYRTAQAEYERLKGIFEEMHANHLKLAPPVHPAVVYRAVENLMGEAYRRKEEAKAKDPKQSRLYMDLSSPLSENIREKRREREEEYKLRGYVLGIGELGAPVGYSREMAEKIVALYEPDRADDVKALRQYFDAYDNATELVSQAENEIKEAFNKRHRESARAKRNKLRDARVKIGTEMHLRLAELVHGDKSPPPPQGKD